MYFCMIYCMSVIKQDSRWPIEYFAVFRIWLKHFRVIYTSVLQWNCLKNIGLCKFRILIQYERKSWNIIFVKRRSYITERYIKSFFTFLSECYLLPIISGGLFQVNTGLIHDAFQSYNDFMLAGFLLTWNHYSFEMHHE